jgi:hypothetical protein
MDDLLAAAVGFAQEMLAKRGEFYPFGAIVMTDGDVAMSAVDPGLGDQPDSLSVIDALTEGFRIQALGGEIKASAICCDVSVRDDGSGMTDAIRTTIEHRESDPVHVLLPYRIDPGGNPSYGELLASRAEPTIFAA